MQYAKEEKEEEVDEDKYLTETTENWIQKYSNSGCSEVQELNKKLVHAVIKFSNGDRNQYSSQVQEWMMKLVQAVAKFRN